jgi:hypothetical protein
VQYYDGDEIMENKMGGVWNMHTEGVKGIKQF